MRKVLIVLGVISVLSLVGALAGSGLSVPGTNSTTTSTGSSVATSGSANTPVSAPVGGFATPTPTVAAITPTPIPGSLIDTSRAPLVLLNPSSARPGSTISVTGSGFDAGTTIDMYLKHKPDDQGTNLGFVQADKSGTFGGFNVTLPAGYASGPFIIVAQQHSGGKQAEATGTVAANSPIVTFGTQVGKPGDVIAYSLKGFAPTEKVSIYFNSLASPVLDTINTDQSGTVRQDNLTVPFGAIGNNSFIFVGQKSQSPVTVSFLMLNLYPTLTVNTYATKADSTLAFSGKGFGPGERVFIHLNSVQSAPVGVAQASGQGVFKDQALFTIPFALKSKATFIAIGEQSQAPATVSIDILPYTPLAETSTYGGRPGTTVTFYGTGFAREELVHVFVGRTTQSQGNEVSCFVTDSDGNFGAAGGYKIDPSLQAGQLVFTLTGDKSTVPATAKMQVMAPDPNEPLPKSSGMPPFHCPYQSSSSGSSSPTGQALPTPTPVATPAPSSQNGGGDSGQ
jgi:hypothetical protein